MTIKACVFVDGENFRHSICGLFEEFTSNDYIPVARWDDFFDWLVGKACNPLIAERLRTYWYVVDRIDFHPNKFPKANADVEEIFEFFDARQQFRSMTAQLPQDKKEPEMRSILKRLTEKRATYVKRSDGWGQVQRAIAHKTRSIQFRRAGAIQCDLMQGTLFDEKAVDVQLAVDLLEFRNFYDVAVIVSGDQDFVPAATIIKSSGKRVINVAFKKQDGKLLPGGAFRLNEVTDWSFVVEHDEFKQFFDQLNP